MKWITRGVGLALATLVGCAPSTPAVGMPAPPPDAPPAGETVQGLSLAERHELFRLPTGSEMIPLVWLKALENVRTKRPFLDDTARFGLVPDPGNPDGLPVGLTVTESKAFPTLGKMVGANCAACHVGEITANGKSLLILGAPNLMDFNNFVVDLNESVKATLDPLVLPGFLARAARARRTGADERTARLADALGAMNEAKESDLTDQEKTIVAGARSALAKAVADDAPDLPDPAAATRGLGSALGGLRQSLRDRIRGDLGRIKQAVDAVPVVSKIKTDVAQVKADLDEGLHDMVLQARLLRALLDYHRKLSKIHEQMAPEPGPGRIDAFGAIRDAVMDDDNFIAPTSPVNYPHIWPVDRIVYFHWDGNTNSWMQRDVGQTLGLGAIFDNKTYFSTVLPRNLARMERLYWKMTAPKWPADLLGPIDQARAARGKTLYDAACIQCHKIAPAYEDSDAPPPYPTKELAVDVPLAEVKTDPGRTDNFRINVGRDVAGRGGSPFADALKKVAYDFTERAFRENAVTPAERDRWDRPEADVKWRVQVGYAGRPLDGIWATAPYLHNGSVPTMLDLLKKPDQRPMTFYVGYREYDPKTLGYVSDKARIPAERFGRPPWLEFDATVKGNLNVGHDYGTGLSDGEKLDLIEYLKTL